MNIKLIIGLITVIIVVIAAVFLTQGLFSGQLFGRSAKVTIKDQTFTVPVATSEKDLQMGLSKKKSIGEKSGLLFTFDKEDYYPFWMKEMQFPIDIIFIRNNRIVTIYTNVQPPKDKEENLPIYKPEEPADSVLEVKANTAEKYNFKKGDEVIIKS